MASSEGKIVKISNAIKVLDTDMVAVNANDGIKFDCKRYSNDRLLFVVKNTEASTAKDVKVLKPSNGGYAAADEDLSLSVAAGAVAHIWVETARYGNNDGSIVITGGSANVKAVGVYIG